MSEPRYRNSDGRVETKSLGEVLRWQRRRRAEGKPPPPTTPIPQVRPSLDFLHANARAGAAMQPTVTWIGHATVYAQVGGIGVLTDPIFSQRASPLSFAGPKRHQPPGIAIGDLPHISLVVISHNHYDHLDAASVKALAQQPGGPPVFVVPMGLREWFGKRGIDAIELDWWQSHLLTACLAEAGAAPPNDSMEIVLVPARHWSGRGLTDRMKTLWGGFAIFSPDCHLFFAGDTGYSRDFLDMRERFAARQSAAQGGGFDIALIPIGAYEPRWFMAPQHVNVEEALKIHDDLQAKRSLGVHWGTFELTDEPLDEPPRELAKLRRQLGHSDEVFFTLAIGETRAIAKR